ncbi:MAG: ParB/Srx family N-terminal domain-containing protein [Acidobacteriia bacterium]|nr:ParB/Srx family N-terminal domain-containing protein [Terriglobia bacterium]
MKQLQGFLQLTIVYLPLSALRINPHNARTHSKRQIRQIAASITEFGFLNGILIDANNLIIAGHGRAEAAKLLGMELVPTIRVENLTEDQIRAYGYSVTIRPRRSSVPATARIWPTSTPETAAR